MVDSEREILEIYPSSLRIAGNIQLQIIISMTNIQKHLHAQNIHIYKHKSTHIDAHIHMNTCLFTYMNVYDGIYLYMLTTICFN